MPDPVNLADIRNPGAIALVHSVTRLREVQDLPDISLHLASDLEQCWRGVMEWRRDPEQAVPFWAFAWPGGLAIAHYLTDHPDVVAGQRVLDMATGSGLCAIAAARAGAAEIVAADIDPLALTAARCNAAANGITLRYESRNLLTQSPPDVDLILAGDIGYEPAMARDMLDWLDRAANSGISVLLGDPGRRYFPRHALHHLAQYSVATTTEIESAAIVTSAVYTFPDRCNDIALSPSGAARSR